MTKSKGVCILNHEWSYQTSLQEDCLNLYSHQQCAGALTSTLWPMVCIDLKMFANLMAEKWLLTVVLILISLIINEVEHLFIF